MASRRVPVALLVVGGLVFFVLIFAVGGGATAPDPDPATSDGSTSTTPVADIIISGDVGDP